MQFLNKKKSKLQLFRAKKGGGVSLIISSDPSLVEIEVSRKYSGVRYKLTIQTSPDGEIIEHHCEYVDDSVSYGKLDINNSVLLDCVSLINKAAWRNDDTVKPFVKRVLDLLEKVKATL